MVFMPNNKIAMISSVIRHKTFHKLRIAAQVTERSYIVLTNSTNMHLCLETVQRDW